MKFEIHITGDSDKILQLEGVKTIAVDLLKPNGKVLRTEYMTSQEYTSDSIDEVRLYVQNLEKLVSEYCKVVRTKIECPYSYLMSSTYSKYIECHYKQDIGRGHHPRSRSHHKDKILKTYRVYAHSLEPELTRYFFESFNRVYSGFSQVELCVFDTNVEQDNDWFDLYK